MDVCGCALFSFPFFPTTTTTITTTIYSFILWALLLLLLLIKYLYVDLRVLLKILRASARPRYLYLFHFKYNDVLGSSSSVTILIFTGGMSSSSRVNFEIIDKVGTNVYVSASSSNLIYFGEITFSADILYQA